MANAALREISRLYVTCKPPGELKTRNASVGLALSERRSRFLVFEATF